MKNIQKLFFTGIILSVSWCFAQTAERPTWDVKDRWEYQFTQKNDGNKVSEYAHQIEKIEEGKISIRRGNKNAEGIFTKGGLTFYTTDMNYMSGGANESVMTPEARKLQWPLEVGKKYTVEYDWVNAGRAQKGVEEYKATVESLEDITVPAGTFKAYKIVLKGFWNRRDAQFTGGGRVSETIWYAPEIRRWVKWNSESRGSDGSLFSDNISELTKYAPGK